MVLTGFLAIKFLGARLAYWLYLLITLIGFGFVVVYVNRERLKRAWYKLRYPELLVIASIIYPKNMVRDFPILKPNKESFQLQGGTYLFSEKALLKNINPDDPEAQLKFRVDGRDYFIDLHKKLKYRWEAWPRLYYRDGCPYPITFNGPIVGGATDPGIEYTAKELTEFGNSTILKQIYAELEGLGVWVFVFILLVAILLVVLFLLAKIMGWIK